jgi:nitrite reductase/ring-hydroxylating ferredoxin subunit
MAMSDDGDTPEMADRPWDVERDVPPSVDDLMRLDAYLDSLLREQQPGQQIPVDDDLRMRMLAAQMRLSREGVETPRPEFLQSLEAEVRQATGQEREKRRRGQNVSRGRFLRAAATFAGGAGLGVAAVEGVTVAQEQERPRDLIAAGNEHWYQIARAGEVPVGGVKRFSAGGVLGFLINDDGQLSAVSAICTHMGCRLKPRGSVEFQCLCHGSRFDRRGAVKEGLAPTALPRIAIRHENGYIYALGTREDI